MTDLSLQVMKKIKHHQIDALPLNGSMTLPFYEGLSLVNVPSTICRLLDTPDFGQPPLDDLILEHLQGPYTKVVVLLVDAMGQQLFKRMRRPENDLLWGRYFNQAVFSPITSVCPSTTASALTTLWTGEAPAAHGIIGYEMWAKEFGMVINNINHSAATARGDSGGLTRSGFDPHSFLGKPLLGSHLQKNGVNTTAFIHYSIAHSGLSVMQMEDVDVHTYVDEADLSVSLTEHINNRQGIREYIYAYYSDVDTLMHRFSAGDSRVSLQFEAFSTLFEKAFLSNLSSSAAQDTLLILLADHGSMATPKDPRFEMFSHTELMDCLVMQPTCENRLAFFYIKPGKIQFVRDYFNRIWPDDFILVDPDIALDSGLFGKELIKETTRDRLGDLIAIAIGDAYLWWAPKPNHMAGRHGGLSSEEMLVPFYALPLGKVL